MADALSPALAALSPARINRILIVVACTSFVSSLFIRMTDPLVPQIAADFAIEARTAALVGSAFALPWALMQPLLGPLGDLIGKTRVILTCMLVLLVSAAVGTMATSFPLLIASRMISGAAVGGIFPVSMAVYGDLVPVEQRQVGMGRLLTASISGMLMGGAAAGMLAELIPWRGIFIVYGAVMLMVLIGAVVALRGIQISAPRRVHPAAVWANYMQVLRNPRSKICYGAVFLEGAVLVGLFPFVAVLLASIGEPRSSIAGLILAVYPLGGVVYSLLVGRLVPRFSTTTLMTGGGLLAAIGLAGEAFVPPWQAQMVLFFIMGLGFYTLHACILVVMTELAPDARGTAVAGHALSYFTGQAVGPVAYGFGLAAIGTSATILTGAAVMVLVGYLTPRLLARIAALPN
jgi:predicted MFS family arabinose efflux permease